MRTRVLAFAPVLTLALAQGCGSKGRTAEPPRSGNDGTRPPGAGGPSDGVPSEGGDSPIANGMDGGTGPGSDGGAGTCARGLTACASSCVDVATSDAHCGGCNAACAAGETCQGGRCASGASGLVLSELKQEWPPYFELYNGSGAPIDLLGYQLQWATGAAAGGAMVLPAYALDPGEFVAITAGPTESRAGVIALTAPPGAFDQIAVRLLDPRGAGIDFVRTGGSLVPPPAGTGWSGSNASNPSPSIDQSLRRNVYAPDTDSAADWTIESPSSLARYCSRFDRCGAACPDFHSDRESCGGCGIRCGGADICLNGACRPAAGRLWISEVRTRRPPGVELHNPTSAPITVTDFAIEVFSSATWSVVLPARTIRPGGYLMVLADAGESDESVWFSGLYADFSTRAAVAVRDDSGAALDFVRFGASTSPPPSGALWFGSNAVLPDPYYEGSARRDLERLDSDSAAEWTTGTPSTPGFACFAGLSLCGGRCMSLDEDPDHCGACGTACAEHESCLSGACTSAGKLVISELSNYANEWIEVFNAGAQPIDLRGYAVSWVTDAGNGMFTFADGLTLEPARTLVLYEGGSGQGTGYAYLGSTINWSEHIAVTLFDAGGGAIDFVRTEGSSHAPPSGTTWNGASAPNPGNQDGNTLNRRLFQTDTDGPDDWFLGQASEQATCPWGTQDVCGGECVSLSSSSSSCGACGNTCPTAAQCSSGICQ